MNAIFKDKKICGIFPLNMALSGGSIEGRPGSQNVPTDYWDSDTISDLTDKRIACYWDHDKSLLLGSVGRGSLRLWLTRNALNFELSLEENNPTAQYTFDTRMREHDFIGLSPGYSPMPSGKKPILGAPHARIILIEMSLTPHPAHHLSRAWLESSMDKKALDYYIKDTREWIAAGTNARDDKSQDRRYKEFRVYLEEQKKLTTSLANSETGGWSMAKINEFKKIIRDFKKLKGVVSSEQHYDELS